VWIKGGGALHHAIPSIYAAGSVQFVEDLVSPCSFLQSFLLHGSESRRENYLRRRRPRPCGRLLPADSETSESGSGCPIGGPKK